MIFSCKSPNESGIQNVDASPLFEKIAGRYTITAYKECPETLGRETSEPNTTCQSRNFMDINLNKLRFFELSKNAETSTFYIEDTSGAKLTKDLSKCKKSTPAGGLNWCVFNIGESSTDSNIIKVRYEERVLGKEYRLTLSITSGEVTASTNSLLGIPLFFKYKKN